VRYLGLNTTPLTQCGHTALHLGRVWAESGNHNHIHLSQSKQAVRIHAL
jgi:hypothetical protein